MITLQLSKHKIAALINIVNDTITVVSAERIQLRSLKRAELAAYLFVLKDLSQKLRKKQIAVEDRFSDYNFKLSINEMQAYLLILYRNDYSLAPEKSYYVLTQQKISEPIFKHLLA